ncbi:MAG: sigma-B regulation protein RsbU (phosphoserine phosphatase) [Halieaceae bacterium]|jgi:sigma-B regulation protein RsbU (phosphoserine phosphatase)
MLGVSYWAMVASGTRRILFVDYDKALIKEFIAHIQQWGDWECSVASTPEDALRLTLKQPIDVVVTDMDLPDMRWDDWQQEIDRLPFTVPTIMMSSNPSVDLVKLALRLGATDYFLKPIEDWEAVRLSLERCVEISSLRIQNRFYRDQLETTNTELTANLEVLRQDQQVGRHVQMRMLPSTPMAIGDLVFNHTVIPSLYLSGDFTDYFLVGDHHAAFFIADVSGHGSSSAFVTVLLKNLFARKRSSYIHEGDTTIIEPTRMLQTANGELLSIDIGKYATMIVGVIDLESDILTYSVAGHLPLPVMVTADGADYLQGSGSPVGLFADVEFEQHSVGLPEQFTLALFSDGILEILPPTDLVEKEKYFLDVFSSNFERSELLVERLGLDNLGDAPDDIAALFITRAVAP